MQPLSFTVVALLTASWGGHGLLLALADVRTLTSAPVFAALRLHVLFRFCADAWFRAWFNPVDAKHILERVANLKQEMRDLRVENARLDEPRWSKGGYESRLSRLEQIKMELAALLDQFKRPGK